MNRRQQRRYWIVQRNKQDRIVQRYRTKFFNALQKDVRAFDNYIQENGIQNGQTFINQLLISEAITKVMDELYSKVGSSYARLAFSELRQKNLIDWATAIFEYLGQNFYDKGIFQIVKTSRKIFIDVLNLGINEGWGYAEMSRYLRDTVMGLNRQRAEVIARTEVARAIHAGTYVGADASPFEKEKVWISATDLRVRRNPKMNPRKADHLLLNGKRVNFSDKFIDTTNGVEMLHPHDPSAPASEVIQCRCTYAVVNKRDENGRLIRKQGLSAITV